MTIEITLNHSTLSDSVARAIRKMILNGTLKPGERMNQVKLAEQMNISRGPLREALRLLQNEGLVKHQANKGTFVSSLSPSDAWEIYTLRSLLESEAAQMAVDHLTAPFLQSLEWLIEEFKVAFSAHDLEAMQEADKKFHHTVVRASRHKRLQHMHMLLDVQLGAMFLTMASNVPVRIQNVVENHCLLLDALKSRDKERVKDEFSSHYIAALNDLIESQISR